MPRHWCLPIRSTIWITVEQSTGVLAVYCMHLRYMIDVGMCNMLQHVIGHTVHSVILDVRALQSTEEGTHDLKSVLRKAKSYSCSIV